MGTRLARRLLGLAAFAVLSGGLSGCAASTTTASGVERVGDEAIVRFKPCKSSTAIRRMRVFDQDNRTVWQAVASSDGTAGRVITIGPVIDGYRVDDKLGSVGLERGTTYRVVADATDGTAWVGPTFDPGNLRDGKVLVAGRYFDSTTWRSDAPGCGGRSAARIVAAAAIAGLGAAVVMGVILGPLWLLRRAALRRARETQGHLPWLHDPAPDQTYNSLRVSRARRSERRRSAKDPRRSNR